jgi:hypothetical protein
MCFTQVLVAILFDREFNAGWPMRIDVRQVFGVFFAQTENLVLARNNNSAMVRKLPTF